MKKIDLTGHTYGRVKVLSYYGHKNGRTAWNCLCECGNTFSTTADALRSGRTRSCGCYAKERVANLNRKHGKGNAKKCRIYRIYLLMKNRCFNKNNAKYKNYGARGITICKEWLEDFMNFYNWAMNNGYSDNLSIERIDVNGNYEPNNCKWITMSEQSKNKTNNIVLTYNGDTNILSEWCRILNLNYDRMLHRYNNGWSPEKMFETPIRKIKYYNHNGKLLNVKDISNITGIKSKTIQYRIDSGWDIRRVIEEPLNSRKV